MVFQTKKIQGFLEKQPSVSMFNTLVTKLNEMEDMLHVVEEGSVDNLQKKIEVHYVFGDSLSCGSMNLTFLFVCGRLKKC